MENEKEFQIGFSDKFNYGDNAITYIITKDNTVQLQVEGCAMSLGVTKKSELKDGTISETIRWDRVYDDLVGIDKIPNLGIFKNFTKEEKAKIRKGLKLMTLSKEEVIMWCKQVNTDISNDFMQILTKINPNNIKNIIIKECKSRKEIEFFKLLNPIINSLGYEIINQYSVLSYRIDGYIPELNIAIEYDENDHKRYTYEEHKGRQSEIEKELGCKFVRVSDKYEYGIALGEVIKEINYKLYKPIINMREVLQNDILPNDEISEPYDIDISREKIQICKSYIDIDTEEGEVDQEDIYSILEVDFFKSMFDDINVVRS